VLVRGDAARIPGLRLLIYLKAAVGRRRREAGGDIRQGLAQRGGVDPAGGDGLPRDLERADGDLLVLAHFGRHQILQRVNLSTQLLAHPLELLKLADGAFKFLHAHGFFLLSPVMGLAASVTRFLGFLKFLIRMYRRVSEPLSGFPARAALPLDRVPLGAGREGRRAAALLRFQLFIGHGRQQLACCPIEYCGFTFSFFYRLILL